MCLSVAAVSYTNTDYSEHSYDIICTSEYETILPENGYSVANCILIKYAIIKCAKGSTLTLSTHAGNDNSGTYTNAYSAIIGLA